MNLLSLQFDNCMQPNSTECLLINWCFLRFNFGKLFFRNRLLFMLISKWEISVFPADKKNTVLIGMKLNLKLDHRKLF